MAQCLMGWDTTHDTVPENFARSQHASRRSSFVPISQISSKHSLEPNQTSLRICLQGTAESYVTRIGLTHVFELKLLAQFPGNSIIYRIRCGGFIGCSLFLGSG